MKTKCINCKKEFEDKYKSVNELNKRIYCNECVDKIWEKKSRHSDS